MNLELDSTHDLAFFGGQLQTIDGADEVAQRLKTHLLTYRGEWWLDPSLGIPYYQRVLTKPADLQTARGSLLSAIKSCPGVTSVESLELFYDERARSVSVQFRVLTTEGVSTGELEL